MSEQRGNYLSVKCPECETEVRTYLPQFTNKTRLRLIHESATLRTDVAQLEAERDGLINRVVSAEKVLGGCGDRTLKEEMRAHFEKYPAALSEQEEEDQVCECGGIVAWDSKREYGSCPKCGATYDNHDVD